MAHPAAVLIGADIQPLVQSGFDAPVSALRRQPLGGAQKIGWAAGEQKLNIGLLAQALPENDGALRGAGKAGLLRLMGAAQRVRISVRPRLRSGPVCAHWGGKGCGGGKKLLRGGQPLGQGLAQFLLVGFDRQQEVTPGLLHGLPRGVLLGVEGVEADQTTGHIHPLQQLPHGGDFVGLASRPVGCPDNTGWPGESA